MVFKNVYFHQLHMYKRSCDSDKESATNMKKDYLENHLLNEKVQSIIDNELNQHKCIQITEDDDGKSEVLEILHHDNDYIFARLGRMRDIYQFQLRNRTTFKPDPINKTDDQEIEIFTYLLLDRTNFIISYLREQSAPDIQKLGSVLTQVYKEEEIFGEISSITIEDALPIISKKHQVGTINYKISIPPEGGKYFTQEYTGLSEKEYDMLTNQKSIDFDIKLVVDRNKDAFNDGRNGFEKVIKKISNFASNIKVKAKNDDEYMQEYNIVDSLFTKRQKFNFERTAESIPREIYRQLKNVYLANKSDIEEFCRIN